MRTLIVILIGLILSFLFVWGSGYFNKTKTTGILIFLIIWLVFCIFDLIIGVRAGYSVGEELGIHTVIFALPAISVYLFSRYL